MTKKTKQPDAATREATMMSALCANHGYMFMANKPGKRTTMMYDGKKKTIEPFYLMQLAVPMDSELAKKMLEQFPVRRKR